MSDFRLGPEGASCQKKTPICFSTYSSPICTPFCLYYCIELWPVVLDIVSTSLFLTAFYGADVLDHLTGN